MKLISCHIDNFGRLRDFDFAFSDGLNIVLHENGWGKSTFAAFLCAVFYGLPGNRRRSGRENERERYRPWQGGVYGGSLLFETGGEIYEVTRTFGRRESEDVFEVRDAETNLPDYRFSGRLGEELFAVDRESFRRTVFIAQSGCGTQATDSIHALLADLAEKDGDLGSYDAAMKRLTDAANRMTPKRKNGSLFRRMEEIRLLERETAGEDRPEMQIAELETELREDTDTEKALERKLQDLERQLRIVRQKTEISESEESTENQESTEIQESIENAESIKNVENIKNVESIKNQESIESKESIESEEEALRARAAQGEIIRRLRRTEQVRRDSVLEAAGKFPGRIPPRAEVERFLQECRSLEFLEYRMQEYMLSDEEQDRLTELEKKFAEKPSAVSPGQRPVRKKTTEFFGPPAGKRGRKTPEAIGSPAGKRILCFCLTAGLLSAAAGVCLFAGGNPVIGGGLAAAGAVVSGAGTALYFLQLYFLQGKTLPGTAAPCSEDGLGESGPEAVSRAAYTALQEKERKLEETHARWAETRRPAASFLRELGFEPEDDLRSQLERIRDAADDYEDAQALLREAEQERRKAEAETPADIQAEMEEFRLRGRLQKQAEEVREDLLCCRQRMKDRRGELEELCAEQEEREAAMQRLQSMREEQEAETADYRRVITAAALLQRARESLNARYADPVRRNFGRYWETVTAASAAGVYLDADYGISVEELGRQRDIAGFSSGYRDLAGICLRISLADAMYRNASAAWPPLILDDPFANLDDEKMEGAMRLLRKASEKYQILYFTCSRSRTLPPGL